MNTPKPILVLDYRIPALNEQKANAEAAGYHVIVALPKHVVSPPGIPPGRTLPWRPFHPVPLEGGPEPHLRGAKEDTGVRAIMELLEQEISSEVDDVCRFGNENVGRSAGCLEALRNFHAAIKAAVEGGAE